MAEDQLARLRQQKMAKAAKKAKKAKAKKNDDKGLFADVVSGVGGKLGDMLPELGVGNLGKMVMGAPAGILRLGTSLAPGGQAAGEAWSQMGNGILYSMANTASTGLKPFGIPGTRIGASDLFENAVESASGAIGEKYRPQDFLERARDKNVGLLPAIVEDVGNVALAAGGAGVAAKAGGVGKLAAESVAKTASDLAPQASRLSARALKATEKASKVRDAVSAGKMAPISPEAVASRTATLGRIQTAAHPYQAAMQKVIRPLGEAANRKYLATEAAAGRDTKLVDDAAADTSKAGAVAESVGDADASAAAAQGLKDLAQPDLTNSRQVLDEVAREVEASLVPENLRTYAAENPDIPLQPSPTTHIGDYDAGVSKRLAEQYDDPAYNRPNDPDVKAAYEGGTPERPIGFLEHTKRQFIKLTQGEGVAVRFHGPDEGEYASFAEMRADIETNGQLRVRGTDAHGDVPNEYMARIDPETGISYNDMFRAVHDAYGHAHANDFGRAGELTSFRSHAQWYPPDMHGVLANESAAQTASLIESKTPLLPDGVFPPQKAGIVSDDIVRELLDPSAKIENPKALPIEELHAVTPEGKTLAESVGIEPERPFTAPTEAATAAHAARDLPAWAIGFVEKLPPKAVKALDQMDQVIKAHDVRVVRREHERILEARRRQVIQSEGMRVMADQIARPLINRELANGQVISRVMASELVGAEVMARLDGVDILAHFDEVARPIVQDVLNRGASEGNRIPPQLIKELDLEPLIQQAVETVRQESDYRLATLLGSRLSTQGLEDIGSANVKLSKRQVQLLKQADRLYKQQTLAEAMGQLEIERTGVKIERTTTSIDRLEAGMDADAARAAGVRAEAEGLYDWRPLTDPRQRAAAYARAMELMDETSGFTLDLAKGEVIPIGSRAGFASAIRDGTTRRILASAWDENPTGHLDDLLENDHIFSSGDVHLGGWRHTLDADDLANGLKAGDEVVDIDASMIFETRDQGILAGLAYNQESIMNYATGDLIFMRPHGNSQVSNLASHYLDISRNKNSQFSRVSRQLRQTVNRLITDATARDEVARVTQATADADALAMMHSAYSYAIEHGLVDDAGVPTRAGLENYYARISLKGLGKNPKEARGLADFRQVMLRLDLDDPELPRILKEAQDAGIAQERWYNNSFDANEAIGRGINIVLGDGRSFDLGDLLPQIEAITSFNTEPITNMGNALNLIRNWDSFERSAGPEFLQMQERAKRFAKLPAEERTAQRLMDELYPDVAPKDRGLNATTQTVTDGTSLYSNEGSAMRAIMVVMNGHTLDRWTVDDIANINVAWGGSAKNMPLDAIPESIWDQARAEVAALARSEVEPGTPEAQSAQAKYNGMQQRADMTEEQRTVVAQEETMGGEQYRGLGIGTGEGVKLGDQGERLTPEQIKDLGAPQWRVKVHVVEGGKDGLKNGEKPVTRQVVVNGANETDARLAAEQLAATPEPKPGAETIIGEVVGSDAPERVGGNEIPEVGMPEANRGLDQVQVERRAAMLYYGSNAWAKIFSFWENLANPQTSRAVTLDTWMARAFGLDDWATKESYALFSKKIGGLADQLGVSPHAVQALIWGYAKSTITGQAKARWTGAFTDAVAAIDADATFRVGSDVDPILARLDEEIAYNEERLGAVKTRDTRGKAAKTRAENKGASDNAAKKAAAAARKKVDVPSTKRNTRAETARLADEPGGPVREEPILNKPFTGPRKSSATGQLAPPYAARERYLKAVDEANAALEAGDPVKAKQILGKWYSAHTRRMTADAEGANFWDAMTTHTTDRIQAAADAAGVRPLAQTAELPPVREGYTRLYRNDLLDEAGEFVPYDEALNAGRASTAGGWWDSSPYSITKFDSDRTGRGAQNRRTYIDIPTEQAEQFATRNMSEADFRKISQGDTPPDPTGTEYVVPREVIEAAGPQEYAPGGTKGRGDYGAPTLKQSSTGPGRNPNRTRWNGTTGAAGKAPDTKGNQGLSRFAGAEPLPEGTSVADLKGALDDADQPDTTWTPEDGPTPKPIQGLRGNPDFIPDPDDFDGLANRLEERILGETTANPTDDGRIVQRFYRDADAHTIVHEGGHAMRQLWGPEKVAALSRSYTGGLYDNIFDQALDGPLGDVRRAAEEDFAADFTAYLASGRHPIDGLQPMMDEVREALRQHWGAQGDALLSRDIPTEVQGLLTKFLDHGEVARAGNALDNLDVAPEPITAIDTWDLVKKAKRGKGETEGQAKARFVKLVQRARREQDIKAQRAKKQARVTRLKEGRVELARAINDREMPSLKKAEKLGQRAAKITAKVGAELEDPSLNQVPAHWGPMWQSVRDLWKEAENDPALAAELEGFPKTFSQVLDVAIQKGFDPTHIRSFTPQQVQNLVYEQMRLGKPGRDIGTEMAAGTRVARTGNAVPATQSIEALAAATIEVMHEAQTNALVDYIESYMAKPIVNGVIPKGYVEWSPRRRWVMTGKEAIRVEEKGMVPASGAEMMIPRAVDKSLQNMGRNYNHWIFKAVGAATKPWRTFILTMSPRWYVNNFMGNTLMATVEGVKLRDWHTAINSWLDRPLDAKFNLPDMWAASRDPNRVAFRQAPSVTGASIYHELDEATLMTPRTGFKGMKQDMKGQKVMGKLGQIRHRITRVNEAVDEIARAAVFNKTLRTTGDVELAIQRGFQALVDYGDLSPFERATVRTVVPFYSWQKGILKLVAKTGIENPAAAGVVLQLGKLNAELLQDQYGTEVPEGYAGVVEFPLIGNINTRGFNPFQDAAQLTKVQGIAASMNPFVEAIVRNELGAPESGFATKFRVDEFGTLVPTTSVAEDLTEIGSTLPQVSLAQQLTGTAPGYMEGNSSAVAAARFAGVNVVPDEQLENIIQRTRESRATKAGVRLPGSRRSKKNKKQVPAAFRRITAAAHTKASTPTIRDYTRAQ